MYKEYIELYEKYTQKYGAKTAIFLMVGSFYELYDIQNQETGETRCNVREIVDLLGIQLSNKKGDFSEHEDGLFAGFPDYVLHKWAGRLTSAGWTVVIVDQVKDAKGKVKERKVSRILSPSTHIENIPSTETPYIATLYFHGTEHQPPRYGAGLLDLTTGSTITYSGITQGRTDLWTADELVQLLSVYPPKEIAIHWHVPGSIEPLFFRRLFGLPTSVPVHVRPVETLGAFAKDLVRTEYLQRIYSIRSLLPPRTFLGLRSEEEETSLLYLLQFVEEHYPSMLRSFHRNESWTPQARLICGNHALSQLQMTGTVLHESVLGLFQSSLTPMGKRSMKERLLSPYASAHEIQSRLNEVEEYLAWPETRIQSLDRQLRYMYDLPRLHRKLLCGMIQPAEIAGLFQTYRAMEQIMTHIVPDSALKEPFTQESWHVYQSVFHTHFSEDKSKTASADQSVFNHNTYPTIGEVEESIRALYQTLETLRKEYAIKGGVALDAIRLEEREKEPFGLKASSITLQNLKKKLPQLPEGTKITELKSGGWIDAPQLHQINQQMVKARERLETLVRSHLSDACLAISDAGFTLWQLMEHWISHVDNTQCVGKVAQEHAYVRPEIDEDSTQSAYVEIQQIRHPLVEATASRLAYVKHDIALGSTHANGWLVYGMNASGKSTLMKATGLCILLAQAGCYVPAKSMRLRPFQAIYTRILNQDNLFAGLSSFAVEMSELRDILRNATENTLVLGDELCSGTESISAQALVASGIQWLDKRNAKFIFATHLHDLPMMLRVGEDRLRVWHLHVDYDPITQKLVYDRSLRPGSGSTLYGLEVARAMDLPFEFIEQALENRHRIIGSSKQEDASVSDWNRQLVRHTCELCKKTIQSDLEVHHMDQRSAAMNGKRPDGSSLHHVSNLIVLCQVCHDEIHAGKKEATPLVLTSNGPERSLPDAPHAPVATKHTKWTEEEMTIIHETLKKYKSMALKSIRAQLHAKHDIKISESMLGKFRKTLYDME